MNNNVKKIAISSGKGGVGKSMLASNLALLFSQDYEVIAVDCDVDVPNLSLWLGDAGNWKKSEKISTKEKPVIHNEKCDGNCENCADKCQFNALRYEQGKLKINPFLCEGCGAGEFFCPEGVIEMKPVNNGEIKSKVTSYGFPLVVGSLFPGETGSGEVVTEVKEKADSFVKNGRQQVMIIDSSPGTGCSVIAALQDVDFVVLVTEPTLSGQSDLKRVLEVVKHFQIPYGVVINKADLNSKITSDIKQDYTQNFLGEIGYDKKVFELVSNFVPILKSDLNLKEDIGNIFNKLTKQLWPDQRKTDA